jgi:hypothetical protein
MLIDRVEGKERRGSRDHPGTRTDHSENGGFRLRGYQRSELGSPGTGVGRTSSSVNLEGRGKKRGGQAMGRKKISLSARFLGDGGHWAAEKKGDVVLVDIIEGLPQGKALDLFEAAPVDGFDARVIGTNSFEETQGSDVVVITSGIPRKPGMSREALLETNKKIVESVVAQVVAKSPNAILILVTNPLDTMTYLAFKRSGGEARVMGMAGCSIRPATAFIAMGECRWKTSGLFSAVTAMG